MADDSDSDGEPGELDFSSGEEVINEQAEADSEDEEDQDGSFLEWFERVVEQPKDENPASSPIRGEVYGVQLLGR